MTFDRYVLLKKDLLYKGVVFSILGMCALFLEDVLGSGNIGKTYALGGFFLILMAGACHLIAPKKCVKVAKTRTVLIFLVIITALIVFVIYGEGVIAPR